MPNHDEINQYDVITFFARSNNIKELSIDGSNEKYLYHLLEYQ